MLSTESDGVGVEFAPAPFQVVIPLNMCVKAAQTAICEREVLDLVSKEAVIEVPVQVFVSGRFVIVKKMVGSDRWLILKV